MASEHRDLTSPAQVEALLSAAAPVHEQPGEEIEPEPTSGVALCLSGGGYRAMLFHTGALIRLNELGWLPRLDRVSSVSGGSIVAGMLAQAWGRLDFDADDVAGNFDELVVDPVRRLAGKTIDRPAIVLGLFGPGSAADRLAAAYRRHLFGDTTLQSLSDDGPFFVFNSTCLQSGVLRRFSKAYAWDWRVGKIDHPTIGLAVAVAASSAYPPYLSPLVLDFPPEAHVPGTGSDLEFPPYTTRLVLTDGGVYDNLGLETAWHRHRTVLVSDGGGHMSPTPRPRAFWPSQVVQVLTVTDNQVRDLRKRQAIQAFIGGARDGTYWGIRTDIGDYRLPTALPAPHDQTLQLAAIATRLGRLPDVEQERLINWGYAVCDAAMRRHVDVDASPPSGFPYPRGVG